MKNSIGTAISERATWTGSTVWQVTLATTRNWFEPPPFVGAEVEELAAEGGVELRHEVLVVDPVHSL